MQRGKKSSLKGITQEKVVNIADYRNLQHTKEASSLAVISEDKNLYEHLTKGLKKMAKTELFDSRFSFEQRLKDKTFDVVILDDRSLKGETLSLCEKLKRGSQEESSVVIIVSSTSDKATVRAGYEKGCDEWVTSIADLSHLAGLVDYYSE